MPAFLTLTKRGMYQSALGEVTINVDQIVSMDRDEDYRLTDITMSFGRSFSVSESPQTLARMIRDAKETERDGN